MTAPVSIAILAHKPALKARPVNEGQRRLVWWLFADRDVGSRAARAAELRQLEVTDRYRDRLIDGEVVPTNAVAARIAHASRGAIRFDDWCSPPEGAWGDRPVERPALRLVA